MRVLLAGASGTLARALVPQLVAAGHGVLGLTRTAAGADRIRMLGAVPIVADVLDRDALLAAVRGRRADAVVHELTALSRAPLFHASMRATNELRERGTAHLIDAAREVGATSMLTQSIVFGYGFRRPSRSPLTEAAPFAVPEHAPVDPVHAALASTERQVFGADGLDGIALRYGLFYGYDGGTVAGLLRRRSMPATRFDGAIPFVHHEDAASATVAALERGAPGRAYNVADDSVTTWRGYLQEAARAFDTPPPLIVPAGLLRIAAPYAGELMTRIDLRVDSSRAHEELGWRPRYPSPADGLHAAAVHLKTARSGARRANAQGPVGGDS